MLRQRFGGALAPVGGPESEAVIDKLLYVGASRAIMSLTVIGSITTRDRLGSEVSRP